MAERIIDYTKMPLGECFHAGVVEVCPECGRNGVRKLGQYRIRGELRWQLNITHKLRAGVIGGEFGPLECFDSCCTTIGKAGNKPTKKKKRNEQ